MSERTADQRDRWALVLGASSGFGAATALALARDGYGIIGVHLDLRSTKAGAEVVRGEIAATGVPVHFHNLNAANDKKRIRVIADIGELFEARRADGRDPFLAVFLHSLAFGTMLPYLSSAPSQSDVQPRQLEMTADVMAHSMVYWTRELFYAGLFGDGTRVFAMTSEGASRAVPDYGPVSAAKATLESHCRQLALELMPSGITVNALRAGIADTPASRAFQGHEELFEHARLHNPAGRMTRVEDIAEAIVALSSPRLHWMTGNTIGVDGGEFTGSKSMAE